MSGTSLDGIDLACCVLVYDKKKWNYHLVASKTYRYSNSWRKKLQDASKLTGEELIELDIAYGNFLGNLCKKFISEKNIDGIELIASHGHTVFHQPQRGFTMQLGNGHSIKAKVKCPVVCDFRQLDIALGGEGAPLVPIGDQHLFSEFDVCLNLGGIANLSYERRGKRKAFDVCFANVGLNELSNQIGKPYDKDGSLASKGRVNESWLNRLRNVYNSIPESKPSLSRELFESKFKSIINSPEVSIEDRLRSFCESILIEIKMALPKPTKRKSKILVTGGGALNDELMRLLKNGFKEHYQVVVPHSQIINFKEAIIFAFLGVLRIRNETNVLRSVTGASRDSCSGVLIE